MTSSLKAYYQAYLPTIRNTAKYHGYAIAEHGSMERDYDLIAVPWVEECSMPLTLVRAICKEIGAVINPNKKHEDCTEKPHGRIAYSLILFNHPYGVDTFIDLSIMKPDNYKTMRIRKL